LSTPGEYIENGAKTGAEGGDGLIPRYDRPMTERASPPRIRLMAERDRLRVELGQPIETPGQMTYGSQAAAASQVFEQQRDLALRDRAQQRLVEVEAALLRVDAGTYGQCTRCDRPIAPERLDALPWAALCIDCQRDAAQERR
jgi:DnaK suppressor protein